MTAVDRVQLAAGLQRQLDNAISLATIGGSRPVGGKEVLSSHWVVRSTSASPPYRALVRYPCPRHPSYLVTPPRTIRGPVQEVEAAPTPPADQPDHDWILPMQGIPDLSSTTSNVPRHTLMVVCCQDQQSLGGDGTGRGNPAQTSPRTFLLRKGLEVCGGPDVFPRGGYVPDLGRRSGGRRPHQDVGTGRHGSGGALGRHLFD
jgi:hypothetical protein